MQHGMSEQFPSCIYLMVSKATPKKKEQKNRKVSIGQINLYMDRYREDITQWQGDKALTSIGKVAERNWWSINSRQYFLIKNRIRERERERAREREEGREGGRERERERETDRDRQTETETETEAEAEAG